MAEPNLLAQSEGLNFGSVVEAIIKRSCIVDFGIVQKVVAKGIVDVSVAVARTKQDMFCMTCVLAGISSSAFTLNVEPEVGDRVLIVYPRIYDETMFAIPDGDKKTDVIVNSDAKGYNLMSGIAILLNQYKKASHKNFITVSKGNIKAELNKVKLETTDEGAITVDNGKATVSIDSSGNVSIEAQGKYTIKNNSTDLMNVIDGLAKELENLTTTGSQTAQATSATSKASIALWRESKLNLLFSDSQV